jgi:hypothetical protein
MSASMPLLDHASSASWFHHNAAGPFSTGTFRPVELAPEPAAALERLGRSLDEALTREPQTISSRLAAPVIRNRLTRVLDQLGPARRYRLFDWLAGLHDSQPLLTAILNTAPAGPRLRAGLLAANRRETLARIFAPDRLRLLLSACPNSKET